MKALFVSQYADPNLVSGNNNVFRQARALTRYLDVTTEVLTWPEGDTWSGPAPAVPGPSGFSRTEWTFEGVKYHIVGLPRRLLDRVMNEDGWRQAVQLGRELLLLIRPDIVHLQHWRGLWWMLEAARSLGIPTVYSSHDWGLGCLRTTLVKGEGGLCDGVVEIEKCARCIWTGRSVAGKANELLAANVAGQRLLAGLGWLAGEQWLVDRELVRLDVRRRISLNTQRVRAVLANLAALIVPSVFAKDFFLQFGIAERRVHVEPWYSDFSASEPSGERERVVCGYIGRISPDKGVRRIFEALLAATDAEPVHLVIAGAIRGEYAEQLHAAYKERVGKHTVEWMGFLAHADARAFYEKVDVVLISSEWMDNTPLSLVEALACKRPVIVSDLPTVRELVEDGRTGYLVAMGSTSSLAEAIAKVSRRPAALAQMRAAIRPIKSTLAYASVIRDVYHSILHRSVTA